MAARAKTASPIGRLIAVAVLALPSIAAPLALHVGQAVSRTTPTYAPAHAGKTVALKAVVAAPPISFLDYQHLALEEAGVGIVLEGPDGSFDKFRAGDVVEVTGKISARAGMVVLIPSRGAADGDPRHSPGGASRGIG